MLLTMLSSASYNRELDGKLHISDASAIKVKTSSDINSTLTENLLLRKGNLSSLFSFNITKFLINYLTVLYHLIMRNMNKKYVNVAYVEIWTRLFLDYLRLMYLMDKL